MATERFQLHERVTIKVGTNEILTETAYCGAFLDLRHRLYFVFQSLNGEVTYIKEANAFNKVQKPGPTIDLTKGRF